jgi:uncharacterized protein (TIGR02246 family)
MTMKLLISMTACVGVIAIAGVAAGQSADDAQIRDLQNRQADAWNHHDARAYASLFTKDGEVINVVGWWWKGRTQIESRLADAFAYVFAKSTMTITDVQTRHLAPNLALAHVSWTMTGSRTPPNIPEPREGIEIQVLKKMGGRWLIYSFQNTNSVPERPFPKGPPPSNPPE